MSLKGKMRNPFRKQWRVIFVLSPEDVYGRVAADGYARFWFKSTAMQCADLMWVRSQREGYSEGTYIVRKENWKPVPMQDQR